MNCRSLLPKQKIISAYKQQQQRRSFVFASSEVMTLLTLFCVTVRAVLGVLVIKW
jgi:predicted ABC-type exoprotein transport system permease subunit